jgi:isocitrate/isopropylmalate dehydrogenase
VLSAAHMLDYLGEADAAARVRAATLEPVAGSTIMIGDTLAARVAS